MLTVRPAAFLQQCQDACMSSAGEYSGDCAIAMEMAMEDQEMLVTLTADIVAAHVSNNSVAISDIPVIIRSVHDALARLGQINELRSEEHTAELPSLMRISY